MPEFLTERTHLEDFRKQTMVFTGAQDLLTKIFVGKKFTVMSPLEAELTKFRRIMMKNSSRKLSWTM